jgi:hypothetical protein
MKKIEPIDYQGGELHSRVPNWDGELYSRSAEHLEEKVNLLVDKINEIIEHISQDSKGILK